MFMEPPTTEEMRERRLLLIEVIEKGHFETQGEIIEEMRKRFTRDNVYAYDMTLINDLKACSIAKVNGVWTRIPIAPDETLFRIFASRMKIAGEQVFRNKDIVVINTNEFGAPWVVHPLREMNHDLVLSIMCDWSQIWVMCQGGQGRKFETWVTTLWGQD